METKSKYQRLNIFDLYQELTISLFDTLLGIDIVMDHPSGKKIRIKQTDIIQPDSLMKIKGKGMPKQSGGYGDFYIKFSVKLPKKITKKERKILMKLNWKMSISDQLNDNIEIVKMEKFRH